MAYHMEAIDSEREARATAKRREQERREARAVKRNTREMWSTEESESC